MKFSKSILFSRRRFLNLLGVATVVSGAPLAIAKSVASIADPNAVSFDEFMDLSRTLTDQSDLDPDSGRKIYDTLGDRDTQTRWRALQKSLKQNGLERTAQDPEHRKAIVPLVRTWYVGIIFREAKAPVFITYFGALMFRATRAVGNIPATCGGAFGYWSTPPEKGTSA